MSESVVVRHDDGKTCLPINKNGNVSVDSLKRLFPCATSLAYRGAEGQIHSLPVSDGEILIDSETNKVDEYILFNDEAVAAPQVPVTNGIHKEEDKLQDSEFPPEQDNNKTSQKRRKGIKTLRIRWLHKGPKDKRYKPMPKSQGGGMRKLKLDESRSYSASDICQLAIEAFELCPANEPEHELAELGLFGGHSIDTFRLRDRADVCDDIWDYCRLRSTGLYNLNLYLLTRPRAPDDVRLLYRYARLSKYSSESFYTECSRGQLHSYVLEQHCGDGPSLDEFEPLELGYRLSRFEKDGKVLLQMKIEEEEEGSMSKNYEFPQAASEPGEHEIVHDLIRGVYNGTLGLGLVVSCTEACRPIYTWYRDGEVYKSAEYLCWLSGIKDERDGQSHVWSCMVTCQASDKQLKSKEVEIED